MDSQLFLNRNQPVQFSRETAQTGIADQSDILGNNNNGDDLNFTQNRNSSAVNINNKLNINET